MLYNHLLFIPHNVRKPQIKGRDKVNTILLNKRGVPSSRLRECDLTGEKKYDNYFFFFFLFVLQFTLLIRIKSDDPTHLGELLGAWQPGVSAPGRACLRIYPFYHTFPPRVLFLPFLPSAF